MDLVLFGVQGSGKGTQAKRLSDAFGYKIFEAGGALRAIAASGSELGNTVKSYIDVGQLVPHEIIMQVVRQTIVETPMTQKLLFDGVPRDDNQRHDFDAMMKELGREFTCIEFAIPRGEVFRRLKERATDQGRADDVNEEVIERRIATFFEKTVPVIDAYEAAGKLAKLNGLGTKDEVYEEVKRELERMKG